jgi:hypothetical protein
VLEDEDALVDPLQLVDEFQARELGELRADRGCAVPDALQQPQQELAAQHRGRLQHPPRFLGQPVDARGEDVLHGLRHAGDGVEVGAVERRAGELLEEEGVALGAADEALGERLHAVLRVQDRANHRQRVAGAQARQRDLGGV